MARSGQREGMSVFGTDYDTRDGTAVRDYFCEDLAKPTSWPRITWPVGGQSTGVDGTRLTDADSPWMKVISTWSNKPPLGVGFPVQQRSGAPVRATPQPDGAVTESNHTLGWPGITKSDYHCGHRAGWEGL